MAVFITPVNKTLLIRREEVVEKKNEFGIIVPDAGKLTPSAVVVKLISTENKSVYEKYIGQSLLVRTNMIEEIEFMGARGTFISESGVIAVIAESGILE